jgi:transglutaminase-like putative cysteine protease
MTIDRVFNVSSASLVLLSVVGVGVALDAPWLLLTAGALVVLARVFTEGSRGRTMGRGVSLICTLAAAVVGVVQIVDEPVDPLPAIAIFAVWLTIIKCCERRTMENEAERIVLSYLLVALSAMISVEALFGLIFLMWVPLAVVVMLLFQVQHGRRMISGGGVPDDDVVPPPAGPLVRRHLAGVVAMDFLLLAVVAVAVFLVFPRGLTDGLATAAASSVIKSSAGNSQRMELVSGARILSSDNEVARVRLLQGEAPAGGVLRLRTSTMSEYLGGGRWRPSPLAEFTQLWVGPRWTDVGTPMQDSTAELSITLSKPLDFLPVPSGLQRIKADRFTRLRWDDRRGILSAPPNDAVLDYEVEGGLSRVWESSYEPVAWVWTDPDVVRLARRLLRDVSLPELPPRDPHARGVWTRAAADAFVTFLRSGRYTYTLDLRRVGNQDEPLIHVDPVARFLLEEPIGHCEYFAAAFTALAHAVNIQARIVTGFVTLERDMEDRWIVRDRDAHAWSEVMVESGIWEAYDATPAGGPLVPGGGQDGSITSQFARLRAALENWWYGDVLAFDASAQRMFIDRMAPRWRQRMADFRRWVLDQRGRLDLFFGFGPLGTVWLAVVLCILAGVFVLVVRGRRRRRNLASVLSLSGPRDDRLAGVAFYGEVLRMLRRAGLAKPDCCSPLAWSHSVARLQPDAGPPLQRLVHVLYRRRFGGLIDDAETSIETDLSDLAAALGQRRGRGT